MNLQLLYLVNDAKVCGEVNAAIVRCCAGIPVNLAGEFLQVDFDNGKSEDFKVGDRKSVV